ncbi:lytic murein transglycosylase [Corticibacter populi]|uniref:peptidoglycan lytic exotransglycosylase n=1 Tax=Corticibacter populi TaxID=1550736 RepID=A0A3M6QMG3_9BURK|nr:MltA domain-containing protein [Corticibacter populi]RMX04247.1 lytic murein transglycosylase [Corticibacter populi]RZS33289.1 membrane-bound lytic murein transglycosylase A [Corticibacter populi]
MPRFSCPPSPTHAKRAPAVLPHLLALLLTACSSLPDPAVTPAPAAAKQAVPAASAAPAGAVTQPPVPALAAAPPLVSASTAAPLGEPFNTRHARFEPIAFAALPGWSDDSVRESLQAFQQSCIALRSKTVWQQLCPRVQRLDSQNEAALRRFFEDNFFAYAVRDAEQASDQGVITGYYEPILNGSRQRNSRFAHPVHGVPADLLFLDARQVQDGQHAWLRLNGRQLVPAAMHDPGAQRYAIQLGGLSAGIRDKRYRVRIQQQGTQPEIVPYWSRQQIEQRALDAQVLAWVDDAFALYSMQIQGSGKIRLAESDEIIRVAYGEQNGHPFLPRVSRRDSATVSSAVKTRGLYVGAAADAGVTAGATTMAPSPAAAPAAPAGQDADVARIIAALGGRPASAAPPRAASALPAAAAAVPIAAPPRPGSAASGTSRNAEVDAIIAALQGRSSAAAAGPSGVGVPAVGAGTVQQDSSDGSAATGASTGIPDPSYVFFRLIPDGPHGPLGALGVPLTAGRSIAVDPRTTPLGYPVFLSTTHGGSDSAINRLVFAQDTGGAIRGSVRADYFWGTGQQAGQRAATMKSPGRMWLLLPRTLEVSALATMRTRSLGGLPAAGPLPDCVVADPENCVED